MVSSKEVLYKEIPVLRNMGHKFINKEATSLEFKAVSGGMGVYAQKGGEKFMIRLRIPSGVLELDKFNVILNLAKANGLEKLHFTTRQAIQLHDLSIDSVCDIMEEGLNNDIYTRGGGGNFPRNVSISPLSGVDKEEAFDITNYAMEVNKYFMKNITKYKLPRKLKVSFSSSSKDTGNSTVADLGFLAVKKDEGEYFKLYLAGGLGKNPSKAIEYEELIEAKEVLYHVEAMTKLFIAEGDYENKAKARIRYIVDRMGKEDFIKCYNKHLEEVKNNYDLGIDINQTIYNKEGIIVNIEDKRVTPQKQEGLYSVYFHPINGQANIGDIESIIEKIENYSGVELRLSMSEGIYIRNLNGNEAIEILNLTSKIGGETDLQQSVACIGVPTCQIGIAHSQELLNDIIDYFNEKEFNKDIIPTIHISGCMNSCGTHQLSKIGFAGKKKRVNDESREVFELYLNGCKGEDITNLGVSRCDILKEEIPKFLYELATTIDKINSSYDEFLKLNQNKFNEIINKYSV